MSNFARLRKVLQMKLYSLLATRWGLLVVVLGFFICINTILQIVHVIISGHYTELRCLQYGTQSSSHSHDQSMDRADNLGGRPYDVDFDGLGPIDVVYTWVNGSDPRHIASLAKYRDSALKQAIANITACPNNATAEALPCLCTNSTAEALDCVNATAGEASLSDAASASRFVDNQELKYSLRSILAYAPWVRHIYLVTSNQVPSWLNTEHPRLTVVPHRDIFVNESHLPTFSSPAIEVHLHRIPGLADRFIYMNDDVMFGAPVSPADFYTRQHGQRVYLSWPVPDCAPGCPSSWIGDGYCDSSCDVESCEFDGGDCANKTSSTWQPNNEDFSGGRGGRWSEGGGAQGPTCASGCPDSWLGDRYCDSFCNTAECAFDAGDCNVDDVFAQVAGFKLTFEDDIYNVPKGAPAVYFNMSDVIGDQLITDGHHDQPDVVRTATISQQRKLLMLTLRQNVQSTTVVVTVVAQDAASKVTEYLFNVTVDTYNASQPNANEWASLTNAQSNASTSHDDALAWLYPNGVPGSLRDDSPNQSQSPQPPHQQNPLLAPFLQGLRAARDKDHNDNINNNNNHNNNNNNNQAILNQQQQQQQLQQFEVKAEGVRMINARRTAPLLADVLGVRHNVCVSATLALAVAHARSTRKGSLAAFKRRVLYSPRVLSLRVNKVCAYQASQPQRVFDVFVPRHTSFLANGIVAHNCLLYSVPGGVTLRTPPTLYPSLKDFAAAHTAKLKYPRMAVWQDLMEAAERAAKDLPPKEEAPEEDAPERDDCCLVCWDSPIETVFLECGHMACCKACSASLSPAKCPMCRSDITRIINVFKPH